MKPRLVQLMLGITIAGAALSACRKEVPTPPPSPDRDPKPTVSMDTRYAFSGANLRFGS
jgi:hypothetical protein